MFVIAGNPDCKKFACATSVARFLSKNLPNFKYHVIVKILDEWRDTLADINRTNGWNFTEGPVIWKELITGGKRYKIGGLSEFWEYCYNYYGVEPHISENELQDMLAYNIAQFNENKVTYLSPKRIVVSIIGGSHDISEYLLEEMVRMEALFKNDGMEIRLFDHRDESEKTSFMLNMAYSINNQGIFGNKPFVRPVKTLKAALSECDLLLILTDFKVAKNQENRDSMFQRVLIEAAIVSNAINDCAKRTLRVVVFNYNIPNCFFANYLVQHAKAIITKNIVVPISYTGLKFLSVVSKRTGVSLENMSAPPIWGADSINLYIDMRAILYKGHVCKPFKRSLTSPPNSSLPLGVIETELRYLSHLITDEDTIMKEFNYLSHRKKWTLRFPTVFAKVRCIMDILRIWYEEDTEAIISLGVCSNGTFGLPKGIVMSQPTWLRDGHFVPCNEYPVSDRTLAKVQQIGAEFEEIVVQYAAASVKDSLQK